MRVPSRPALLRARAVGILLLATACTSSPQGGPGTPEPGGTAGVPAGPNVLIVLTDDQALGTMGAMPRTRRWLGRGGTTYRNAYVTTPLCCPSRATIFSGQYAHNHGVLRNPDAYELDQRHTMQRLLRERGYFTGLSGKLLNYWDIRDDPPHLDRWAIFWKGYEDVEWNVDGEVRTIPTYNTDFTNEMAQEFLRDFEERDDARPWLLYVHPWAPHGPRTPPERHEDRPVPPWEPGPGVDEEDLSDKPPLIQDAAPPVGEVDWGAKRDQHVRTLFAVDEMMGDLRRTLGELDEASNTLVVFLSDNGTSFAHRWIKGKRIPYLDSIRVPMLVRWPGVLEEGAVDRRPVTNADVAPTVFEAAGVEPDWPVDGRSLTTDHERDHIFTEHWEDAGMWPWSSILRGDVQYIEYYGADGKVRFAEYYDLAADPWQLENLLADDDPGNDPSESELRELGRLIEHDRRCRGTEGPRACP